MGQYLAHHSQGVLLALARRDVLLDAAVKQREADLVVASDGREGQQGAELGCRLTLRARAGAEVLGARYVGHQHQRELTLLDVALDVGLAESGGDLPVDGANVVARYVGANLVELDTPALEDRDVLAGQYVGDLSPGSDLDLANPLDDVFREQGSRAPRTTERECRPGFAR